MNVAAVTRSDAGYRSETLHPLVVLDRLLHLLVDELDLNAHVFVALEQRLDGIA
jgi:hypothetical protein